MPTTPTDVRKGILLLLLAIFAFTAMDALAKGLVARYPTVQVVWVRFFGQLLLVLLLLGRRAGPALRTRFPFWHLARSAGQLGATGFFFASLPFIGLAEATALADINPVLITLGAAVFLGESLGRRRILGVVAAMIGALIIIRPGMAVFTPAALLPLACALCYTANALITRHIGSQEPVWSSMIYGAAFGAALSALALPWVWQPVSLPDLGLFAGMVLLGTAAQLCLIRAFSVAEAGAIAPFAYAGIVFASFWGAVVYGEFPDLATVIGALVIASAGLYVWRQEMRQSQQQDRNPADGR